MKLYIDNIKIFYEKNPIPLPSYTVEFPEEHLMDLSIPRMTGTKYLKMDLRLRRGIKTAAVKHSL